MQEWSDRAETSAPEIGRTQVRVAVAHDFNAPPNESPREHHALALKARAKGEALVDDRDTHDRLRRVPLALLQRLCQEHSDARKRRFHAYRHPPERSFWPEDEDRAGYARWWANAPRSLAAARLIIPAFP
jgi:hypothetical protein